MDFLPPSCRTTILYDNVADCQLKATLSKVRLDSPMELLDGLQLRLAGLAANFGIRVVPGVLSERIHGNDLVLDRADLVQALPGGEKVIAH
ncbi:MAG: hypothetical protein WCJ75_15430 [Desulfomonile sp.]